MKFYTTISDAQDVVNKNYVDTADALKANIASPTFTGTPTAPTASVATNTTQVATTAFVIANAASFPTQTGNTGKILTTNGTTTAWTYNDDWALTALVNEFNVIKREMLGIVDFEMSYWTGVE